MELAGASYGWEECDKKRYGKALKWFERRIFKQLTQNTAVKSCLDIGGGLGNRFPIQCNEYTMVEKDHQAVKRFHELSSPGNCIEGNFLDVELKQKYDLILMIQLSADSEVLKQVVIKAFSLLNDNGLLLFTASNKNSYKGILYSSGNYAYQISYCQLNDFLRSLKAASVKYYGYGWLPFKRDSNSFLIPCLKWLELLLGGFVRISPWLLVALRK